ncbi:MAG: hypothetical protein HY286_06480 [Planctomycetes bacterium]|nr:hypothetical protein [Planctomycetota bacterium]
MFSPDEQWVLSACENGMHHLWCARTDDLLALANRRVTREFTAAELKVYAALLPEGNSSANSASKPASAGSHVIEFPK